MRFEAGVMYVRGAQSALTRPDGWTPIRAAFRYVTQKPWNRLPLLTKTLILNPVVSTLSAPLAVWFIDWVQIACLAGGRNKMVAAKAYEFFNAELANQSSGLSLKFPETINVPKKCRWH